MRGYFHPVGACAPGLVCDGGGRVPRAKDHLAVLAVAERLAETL